MKKRIILLPFLLVGWAVTLLGQDTASYDEYEYIFSNDIRIGGFGGPLLNMGSIGSKTAVYVGGGGAMTVNEGFFLGGYGIGLINSISAVVDTTGQTGEVEFGHGGIWLGYSFLPRKVVHPTISLKAGWGALGINNLTVFQQYLDDDVFVLTPALELEFNVTSWLKIAAGSTYQWVTGLSNPFYNNSDFTRFAGSLTFKFGYFGED